MFMALGAAASLWDTLQSLATSKSSSTQSTGVSQTGSDPFSVNGPAVPSTNSPPTFGTGSSNQISPQTMSALLDAQSQIDAQGQTGTTSTAASTTPSQALQNLFSDIDADGDGSISKQEFENALGAGGTNTAAADNVFNQLDTNGDGSVSLDELKSALQGAGGHHGGHHHMHAASSTSSADGSSSDSSDSDSTDPLMQMLNASLNTASSTSGSSSTTSSSLTPANTSQITPISLSTATYNMIEKMLQSGTYGPAPLSVSA